jgi:hypothetical protein
MRRPDAIRMDDASKSLKLEDEPGEVKAVISTLTDLNQTSIQVRWGELFVNPG